jgi:beta-ribofuranosylaminobenzene 5'-phosphate synthase
MCSRFLDPSSVIPHPSIAQPVLHSLPFVVRHSLMPSSVIYVSAPSRLHFGMLSFGRSGVRQFGGVGAMIAAPRLEISFSPSDRLEAAGPLSERVLEYARRASSAWVLSGSLGCRIEVLRAPPQHVGLGSGTQLGMSVAAGLNAFLGRPPLEPVDLAKAVQRGMRSAIGVYGFAHGGLLVEAGKLSGEEISPLVARIPLPPEWRFLLALPAEGAGLSGEEERRAFERLPPVPEESTAGLCEEVLLRLLPSAAEKRFGEFAASLSRLGAMAGSLFADVQGGPFARPDLVELLKRAGLSGVAQSSWGPGIVGMVPSDDAAQAALAQLMSRPESSGLALIIAAPDNRGAVIGQDVAS